MKVAMITWDTDSGISTYSRNLIEKLRRYVDVKIIPINKPYIANPFIISDHFFDLFYIFKIIKNILSVKRKDLDIIHIQGPTWTFAPLIYLILSFRNRQKIITTIHDTPEKSKSTIVRIYGRLMDSFATRHSDAIIVHTQEIRELLEKYNAKKVFIIPHGSYQNPIFLNKNECKEKLGLKGKKVLTIFGFICEEKGYETILRILPKLDREVVFLIAGGIPSYYLKPSMGYFQKLKKEVRNNERVKITGYIEEDDIPTVLNASDIMLLPYLRATQSGPLNMALSYRKPFITSNLAYFREIKEKYNCIEIAKDENDFLEKIEELLENKEKRECIIKNAQIYLEETNWDTVAKRHYEFYSELDNSELY